MASTFQYSPLEDPANEIRLLRIAPDDPFSCRLSTHKLKHAPKYRAISYAWGDAAHQRGTRVNEHPFDVRENCLCALKQAHQHLPEGTYIWLDAICINQADNAEKGHQVAMMGDIFFRAESVFVSVGKHYNDSEYLFDVAAHLGTRHAVPRDDCPRCHEANRYQYTTLRKIEQSELHAYHSWLDNIEDQEYARLRNAFHNFGRRPYWNRMWIIQETMCARKIDVACGGSLDELRNICFILDLLDMSCNLDCLGLFADRDFGRYERRSMDTDYHHLDFLWNASGLRHSGTGFRPRDLLVFLRILADFQCAEIRDRIYGLLGVVDWGRLGPPKPDYATHPLSLALQVLARMFDADVDRIVAFPPDQMAELFKALGVDSMRLESSTTCGRLQGHTSVSKAPRHCDCESPTAPQISFRSVYTSRDWRVLDPSSRYSSLRREYAWQRPQEQRPPREWNELQRLFAVYSLQEGDILLRAAGRAIPDSGKHFAGACLCVVLRKSHGDYYEILDEAPKVSTDLVDPYHLRHLGNETQIRLCLDLRDAASMALSLVRLERRAASGCTLDGERHSLSDPDHVRARMSSYAILQTSGKPLKVMGAFSTDGKSIPCARCGGMFEPTERMLAEHAQREADLGYAPSSLDD